MKPAEDCNGRHAVIAVLANNCCVKKTAPVVGAVSFILC